jgi:hypothetical protein
VELPLTGGCLCGGLRYEIGEAPLLTYTCHCTDCQRISGSAFSVGIVVPESAFTLLNGEPRPQRRIADSGRVSIGWVCPDCSCWVFSDPHPRAGQIVRRLRAGTLDDTSWLRPTVHVWTRSKQPWVFLPEGDKIFDTQPE